MSSSDRLSALYQALELPVPERFICCDSPQAGLKAVLEEGRPLFEGTEPQFFLRLMRIYHGLSKRYSHSSPATAWKATKEGARLHSRACLVSQALSEEFPDQKEFCREFRFDPHTWRGDDFELRQPRCMSSDAVAEIIYEVTRLGRGKIPPAWDRFKEFCANAGWVWPFDRVAVICSQARRSLYDNKDRLHCADGPAVTFLDRWSVWAWQGRLVPRQMIEDPGALSEEELLSIDDLHLLRLMLERRGQPVRNPRLQTIKRMLEGRQFQRFDRRHVPSQARPWPAKMALPTPPNRPGQVPPDGVYYKLFGDGQLQLLAWAEKGQMIYLRLEYGRAAGFFHVHMGGEQYFEDGRMEDFSPWDDSSPPYYVEKSFADWVRDSLVKFPGLDRGALARA
ncbi:MAG: hypothetical protein U0931_36990 [Vulcanimicrobiota bacterium]